MYLQEERKCPMMSLHEAVEEKEYTVKEIMTDDDELNEFLFSLGCYSGERITVIARKKNSCTIVIKDGRYNIDADLAKAIAIEEN